MGFKAAFLFVAPETDYSIHKAFIDSPSVQLDVIGVSNYQEAENTAIQLVNQGVEAINLCAGFGIEGTAKIKAAVSGKAIVGVLRFDGHPGFNHQSGDELFK